MRVLVADDSALDRLALRTMVEQLGHTCDEAVDGDDAWAQWELIRYDVILTDWKMPRTSGLELCRRIRKQDGGQYVFTAICTTLDDREHGLEAVRAGADLLLTKPVDLIAVEMCLITAARVTATQVQLTLQNAELQMLNATLAEHARTDQLTGLANRRRLDDDLEVLASLAARYDMTTCVAMCDVDRFKAYNDRFGHLAGDQVLKALAAAMERLSRESDTIYRFGGEELLILLPHQDLASAEIAVERLRRAIEAMAVEHPDNAPYGVVTVSFGLASLQGRALCEPRGLVEQADAALYEAKRTGRNRVVCRPRAAS